MRELRDSRGLARPVDPDHQNDLGARESIDFQRLGDRTQDRRNLLGHDPAQFVGAVRGNVAAFGQAIADTRGHAGAKIGGNQRLLDPVEVVFVETRLARQSREIFAKPFRRAPKAAEQPLAPARSAHPDILSAIILSPSRAPARTGTMAPGSAGAVNVSAAKFSAWPVRPSRSTNMVVVDPVSRSSQA